MIKFTNKSDFKKTYDFLADLQKFAEYDLEDILKRYGEMGVKALSAATPKDTGITASSWKYTVEVEDDNEHATLTFSNSSVSHTSATGWEPNIVILVRNGHATKSGGWVPPNDFITPVISPLVESLKDTIWKEAKD